MTDEEPNGDGNGDWPWSTLSIDPTAGISDIRSAYAAAIKKTRPEDDAGGFQDLREARDAAIAIVKSKATPGSDKPQTGRTAPPEAFDADEGAPASQAAAGSGEQDEDELADVLNAIEGLTASPWAYTDIAGWQKVMNDAPLLNDRLRDQLEHYILQLIDSWLDGARQPEAGVILYLDDTFGWSTARSNLDRHLPWERALRLRTIVRSLRV